MTERSPHDVTRLLEAWNHGDQAALEELTPLVYSELRRLARRYMGGERPGHTLQTTALAHEAYIRLVNWKNVDWQNRAHFFAMAAGMMRRILVDFARSRRYAKRGGGVRKVSLSEAAEIYQERTPDLVALDDALTSLATFAPRQSQVVQMRYFGGLSIEETAEVLKVSPATVRRDWSLAQAWLFRELRKGGEH